MREVLSVQELFAAMIRKGTVLICLGLVFAILLGGWQCLTLREKALDPKNTPEKIEARYQKALEKYKTEKAELEKKLARAEDKLKYQSAYMENSTLINLDPYNTPRCTVLVAVTGLQPDEGAALEAPQEQIDRMTEKILQMYLRCWKLADLHAEMESRDCAVTEEKYMREVMLVDITDGGTLTIKTANHDLDEATRQAYAIYDLLLSMKPLIEESTYPHELTVLDSTSKYVVAENIETRQTTEDSLFKTCTANVEKLRTQLSELKEPKKESYSTADILKGSIKWGVIGGVLGVFLGCILALCRALLGGYLQNKQHMEDVLQVPFMGSAAPKGNIFRRIADRLVCEPRWEDPEEAYNFVSQNMASKVEREEKVVILTTLSQKEFAMTAKNLILAAETACGGALCIHCADRNAWAVSALKDYKKVLLAERVDVSKGQRVLAEMELAKRMGATVVGFVTV